MSQNTSPTPKPNNAVFTAVTLGRDTVMTAGDLHKLDYTMREPDLKGRLQGKGGALRPSVLAAQRMYVTYDYPTILHVLSNGTGSLKSTGWLVDLAKKQAARGAIVIPYVPLNATAETPIQQRLKPYYTEKDKEEAARSDSFRLIKYYSPLNSKNEPYIPELLVDKSVQNSLREELVQDAVAKSKLPKDRAEALARKVLAASGYEKIGTSLKDPTVPIIMIEGEYKGVALAQGMVEANARNLELVMSSPNPEAYDLSKLPPVSYFAVVATIGVNGVVRRVGGKKTGTYELLETFHEVMPKGRPVIVGLDNDCAKNIAVAYSAVSVAQAFAHRSSTVGLLIPPASEKKLGWDDYIVDAGIKTGFEHLDKVMGQNGGLLPVVDAKTTWKDLEAVIKEGKSAIDRVGQGARSIPAPVTVAAPVVAPVAATKPVTAPVSKETTLELNFETPPAPVVTPAAPVKPAKEPTQMSFF